MTTPNYPSNPNVGDEFQVGGSRFKWDGEKWKAMTVADNSLRSELADPESNLPIGNKTVKELSSNIIGKVRLLLGKAKALLFKSIEDGATTLRVEPKGNVQNGTASQLELFFDPFEESSESSFNFSNSRKFSVICENTPDNPVASSRVLLTPNNKGDFAPFPPLVEFKFSDASGLDQGGLIKLWYGDHNQPEWFTPMKGTWESGKTYNTNDYVVSYWKIFKATTTGESGNIQPDHVTGIESDGGVMWEFVYAFDYASTRATCVIGNTTDRPILGHPRARLQILRDFLVGWSTGGTSAGFLDGKNEIVAKLKTTLTGSPTLFNNDYWLEIETFSGGKKRFSKTLNYEKNENLATVVDIIVNPINSSVIDCTGKSTVQLNNTSPTTITNIIGGVAGQRIRLTSNNNLTTIEHNESLDSGGVIKTAKGSNIQLNNNGCLDLERAAFDYWRVVGVGY